MLSGMSVWTTEWIYRPQDGFAEHRIGMQATEELPKTMDAQFTLQISDLLPPHRPVSSGGGVQAPDRSTQIWPSLISNELWHGGLRGNNGFFSPIPIPCPSNGRSRLQSLPL